jgi:hypothetical protein
MVAKMAELVKTVKLLNDVDPIQFAETKGPLLPLSDECPAVSRCFQLFPAVSGFSVAPLTGMEDVLGPLLGTPKVTESTGLS